MVQQLVLCILIHNRSTLNLFLFFFHFQMLPMHLQFCRCMLVNTVVFVSLPTVHAFEGYDYCYTQIFPDPNPFDAWCSCTAAEADPERRGTNAIVFVLLVLQGKDAHAARPIISPPLGP